MSSMNLKLRSGEKLYLNGAVFRCDRKVTLEIMNDVSFLLECHVLQVDEATTPLRQLYFAVQSALMDPSNAEAVLPVITEMLRKTLGSFENLDVRHALIGVHDSIGRKRFFEALTIIRRLYGVEAEILGAPRGGHGLCRWDRGDYGRSRD